MPEGDTIHKIANFLAPRLGGRVVQRLELAPRYPGRPVAGSSRVTTWRVLTGCSQSDSCRYQ